MDELTYGYNLDRGGRLLDNRLRHVKDEVSSGNYTTDIDDQGDDNYAYDEIGNLISDDQEGISEISWNVYGKISSITKSGPVTITYEYDASGNRIGKTVNGKYTWYVRDASGNVMAVYEDGNSSINSNALSQIEVHLYGSARLGMWQANRNVASPPQPIETALTGLVEGGVTVGQERGKKIFELSNHLGNVLVTISDRRVEHNTSGTIIDYYEAGVVSASDYYPFGMGMAERKYSVDGYRYGFNGKEKDKDIGEVTVYDYGFRIYNPAIGKFLSVDPLTMNYPMLTPYQFAGDNPAKFIDLDGLEVMDPIEVIQEPKSKGEPGLACATVRKVYFVVTSGLGALTKTEQTKIKLDQVSGRLNSTPNEPAYFTKLPSGPSTGQFLNFSRQELRKLQSNSEKKRREVTDGLSSSFYEVDLTIDVDIIVVEDLTLEDIALKVAIDPSRFGIIFNSFDVSQLSTINISSTIQDLIRNADEQFKRHAGSPKGEAEAYGSIISPNRNPEGVDVVIFNTGNPNIVLSMTDRVVHEIGHNFTNMAHGKDYDYNNRGLESRHKIVPNSTNKRKIISSTPIPVENIYDKIILNPSPNA